MSDAVLHSDDGLPPTVNPDTDDANAYRLIRDNVVATLIGENWDDVFADSEESIVIAWAEHVAAFHPAEMCAGPYCTVRPVDAVLQMAKLTKWVEANLPRADMHEERSAVDVIIDLLEAVKAAMPAMSNYFAAVVAQLVTQAGVDVPEVVPYTGPRS